MKIIFKISCGWRGNLAIVEEHDLARCINYLLDIYSWLKVDDIYINVNAFVPYEEFALIKPQPLDFASTPKV